MGACISSCAVVPKDVDTNIPGNPNLKSSVEGTFFTGRVWGAKKPAALASDSRGAQLKLGDATHTENEWEDITVTVASGGDWTEMERCQAAQLVFDNRDASGIPLSLEELMAKMATAPLLVLAKQKACVVGVMALKNKVGTTYHVSESGWFVVEASLRGSDVAKRLGAAFYPAVKHLNITALYGDVLVTNWSSLRSQQRTSGGHFRIAGFFEDMRARGRRETLACLVYPIPAMHLEDGVLETCCEELVAHLCLHDFKHATYSPSFSLEQLRDELANAPKERYGRTTLEAATKDIAQWLRIEGAKKPGALASDSSGAQLKLGDAAQTENEWEDITVTAA